MKCTCSTLSTACHLPCHPKGGFPARAAPYIHPQSTLARRAALVLTTLCPLSAVVCSQLVRAMSFDSDIVVGFHLRLLFEMRAVVCGSSPTAVVRWSTVVPRVGSNRERWGPSGSRWLAGRRGAG